MLLLGRIDLCTALLVLLRQPDTARSKPAAMAISYFCCDSDVLLKFTPISLSSSDYVIASSAFLNSLQSKLEDERSENYIDFACFILEALYNEIAMIMSEP